jgi:hypothetical protein
VTPASEQISPDYRWPLIATSSGHTVEVRCAVARLQNKAVEMIAVIVRLPGRPTGLVSMMVFGKEASDSPNTVMAQVGSMWKLFAVEGAPLPTVAE